MNELDLLGLHIAALEEAGETSTGPPREILEPVLRTLRARRARLVSPLAEAYPRSDAEFAQAIALHMAHTNDLFSRLDRALRGGVSPEPLLRAARAPTAFHFADTIEECSEDLHSAIQIATHAAALAGAERLGRDIVEILRARQSGSLVTTAFTNARLEKNRARLHDLMVDVLETQPALERITRDQIAELARITPSAVSEWFRSTGRTFQQVVAEELESAHEEAMLNRARSNSQRNGQKVSGDH